MSTFKIDLVTDRIYWVNTRTNVLYINKWSDKSSIISYTLPSAIYGVSVCIQLGKLSIHVFRFIIAGDTPLI